MTNDQLARNEFEAVLRSQYAPIYRWLLRLSGDEHTAIDITQDTFRIAWEKWATFDGDSSVGTWLHSIAYRRFLDTIRSTRRQTELRRTLSKHPFSASEGESVAVQIRIDIEAALMELPDRERDVIVLRYLQGMSVKETASVLSQPQGTVMWRTKVALERLADLLGE